MPDPTVTIRQAVASDHDAIWSIMHPVLAAGETYAWAPTTTREEALGLWLPRNGWTYVAERSGQILGTYLLRPNQSGLGDHVANAGFMVAPDASGGGLGALMGAHALDEARRLEFRGMQFNFVVSTNRRAVALWQRLGFAIVGTVPNAFRHPREGLVPIHIMYRDL